MRIHLPNSARLVNLPGFLRGFDPNEPMLLHFSMHERWVAVHPAVLVFTAAIADSVSAGGGSHEGKVTRVGSLPYLIRMGLFDHVRIDPGRSISPHEAAGRFIPIQRIATAEDLTRFIVEMIPLLHATPAQVEPIRYVISELVRNVLEHSRSTRGAFVAAQYFPESKTLGVGVCDAGIGVRASLSEHHSVQSDSDAIYLAMRPGVTGTSARIGGTPYNAGAGLFFTKSIAVASRQYFALYSGDSVFKLKPIPSAQPLILQPDARKDRHVMETGVPRWQGTLVGIDIALDKGATFTALMNLIRRVFGATVREKKGMLVKPRFT